MAIYKEVDELLKAMDTWDKYGLSFGLFRLNKSNEKDYVPYVRYEDMVQAVTGTPHADVAPVIHAHWKDRREDVFDCLDWGICSHCENLLPALAYCGFCGAKMDEVIE